MAANETEPVQSPQLAELEKLSQSLRERMGDYTPGREAEDLIYISGFNAALGEAIRIARAEEIRVRKFVNAHDGTCLDTVEERAQFIEELYGKGSRNN